MSAPIWSDVPALLIDELFRPQVLLHIVITWLGNGWLLLLIVSAIGAWRLRRPLLPNGSVRFCAALALTALVLLVGVRYDDRGSDGNYFAASIAALYMFGLAAATNALASLPRARSTLLGGLVAVALFQAAYSFTSGAWTPGTRAFDVDLSRSVRGSRKQRWTSFENAGIARIADHLRQGSRVRRVGGFVSPPTIGYDLPFRYEDFWTVAQLRHADFESLDALLAYLAMAHIDAIIVPKPDAPATAVAHAALLAPFVEQLRTLPGSRIVVDRNYFLIDLGDMATARR
jgi:hypothetical protein